MNKVAPLICIPLGMYWLYRGIFQYQLWVFHGPGGGLFPAVCGILLIVCGGITLYRNIRDKIHVPFESRPFIIFGAALATMLLVYVFGMFVPLGLFIFVWIRFMGKRPVMQSLATGAVTSLFLYLLFRVLLRAPFPPGLIVEMLR